MEPRPTKATGKPGKRRFWNVGFVALVVVVLVAAAVWPGPKEPEYQGKKLSEWVTMAQDKPGTPAVQAAMITIAINNIPLLLRWLDYTPSKLREWVDDHSDKVPGRLQFLVRNRGDERADTAEGVFWILGMRAAPAIPELLRQAQRHVDATDSRAFRCLGYMGEASFPLVSMLAADKQSPARIEAIWCIGGMGNLGTNKEPAVRQLCELVKDKDVAEVAVTALGHIGEEPISRCLRSLVSCGDQMQIWKQVR